MPRMRTRSYLPSWKPSWRTMRARLYGRRGWNSSRNSKVLLYWSVWLARSSLTLYLQNGTAEEPKGKWAWSIQRNYGREASPTCDSVGLPHLKTFVGNRYSWDDPDLSGYAWSTSTTQTFDDARLWTSISLYVIFISLELFISSQPIDFGTKVLPHALYPGLCGECTLPSHQTWRQGASCCMGVCRRHFQRQVRCLL